MVPICIVISTITSVLIRIEKFNKYVMFFETFGIGVLVFLMCVGFLIVQAENSKALNRDIIEKQQEIIIEKEQF